MSEQEKIKEIIARRLAAFLLARTAKPTGIKIFVEYPLATASITISGKEICEVLDDGKTA